MILSLLVFIVLVFLDQITKNLAYNIIRPLYEVPLFKDVLELRYVENPGAAFGFFKELGWLIILLTICILLILFIYYARLLKSKGLFLLKLALLLIFSGAFGNLIDRFKYGFVVDFIYVSVINFPVFNMADIYVSIGGITIILCVLLDKSTKRTD